MFCCNIYVVSDGSPEISLDICFFFLFLLKMTVGVYVDSTAPLLLLDSNEVKLTLN